MLSPPTHLKVKHRARMLAPQAHPKMIIAALCRHQHQDVVRARRENDQLLSLQSELADARRQNTQLQQLLEEDSEKHPSNKKAKATQASLTRVRKELEKLRSTHAATNRELERALDINDQSVVEYLA